MSKRRRGPGIAHGLALLIMTGTALADPWPIDDFTPLFKDPKRNYLPYNYEDAAYFLKNTITELLSPEDPELERKRRLARDAWARLTRQYLREIADIYQKAGFLPPTISPVVERDGVDTYGVYVVEASDAHPYLGLELGDNLGMFFNSCGLLPFTNNLLLVNRGAYGVGAGSSKRAKILEYEVPQDLEDEQDFYATLAHEVFHAIEDAHRQHTGWTGLCSPHDTHRWITEGTASALGFYLASRKFPGFMQQGKGHRQGARRYVNPLNSERDKHIRLTTDADDLEVYRTSSFWRYMIERAGSVAVIARLFGSAPEEPGRDGRLKWLDRFVRQAFTEYGLYHFWPEFITEFASYGGFRYRQFGSGSGESGGIKAAISGNLDWIGRILLGCQEIRLTPDEPVRSVRPLGMEGISASCVRVQWSGFKDLVEPHAEMIGPDAAILDQLHIGTAYYHDRKEGEVWTCYQNRGIEDSPKPWCNGKELETTGPKLGKYSKSFGVDFLTYSGSGETLFIVSNVAEKPWLTRDSFTAETYDERPVFRFGLDETEGHAQYGPPLPDNERGPGSSSDPGARPPAPKTLVGLTVEKYASARPAKDAKPLYNYGISPDPGRETPFGYTGPFHGQVTRARLDGTETRPVGSMVCRAAGLTARDAPIGKVLESTERRLRVRVAADLCRCETPRFEKCHVVDRFEGTLSLTGGWRHHRDTEPRKLPTPGQQVNDARFDRNFGGLVAAALGGHPQTKPRAWSATSADPFLPDPDDNSVDTDDSGTDGGGGLTQRQRCSCGCEERERLLDTLDSDAGEGDLTHAALCLDRCLTEYRSCTG